MNDALERARAELQQGETLVWADHPDADRLAHKKRRAVTVGLVVSAFALAWVAGVLVTAAASGSAAHALGALFALPFLFFARRLMLKPKRARARAANTTYAITDQRLLVIKDGRKPIVVSYAPEDITLVERHDHEDGTSDIFFAEKTVTHHAPTRREGPARPRNITRQIKLGFQAVAEGRQVEQAVRELRESEGL